jgi:hypothetical protein
VWTLSQRETLCHVSVQTLVSSVRVEGPMFFTLVWLKLEATILQPSVIDILSRPAVMLSNYSNLTQSSLSSSSSLQPLVGPGFPQNCTLSSDFVRNHYGLVCQPFANPQQSRRIDVFLSGFSPLAHSFLF